MTLIFRTVVIIKIDYFFVIMPMSLVHILILLFFVTFTYFFIIFFFYWLICKLDILLLCGFHWLSIPSLSCKNLSELGLFGPGVIGSGFRHCLPTRQDPQNFSFLPNRIPTLCKIYFTWFVFWCPRFTL